ncbi:flagellar hook-length control protein FliK [Oceanisphaera sp. KMM 10153]|uniref:flagellar hook-length control protein FliK n=1 Tax=Oceanisphaera submarina TaxID=3390193 RepID=UPI0039747D7E
MTMNIMSMRVQAGQEMAARMTDADNTGGAGRFAEVLTRQSSPGEGELGAQPDTEIQAGVASSGSISSEPPPAASTDGDFRSGVQESHLEAPASASAEGESERSAETLSAGDTAGQELTANKPTDPARATALSAAATFVSPAIDSGSETGTGSAMRTTTAAASGEVLTQDAPGGARSAAVTPESRMAGSVPSGTSERQGGIPLPPTGTIDKPDIDNTAVDKTTVETAGAEKFVAEKYAAGKYEMDKPVDAAAGKETTGVTGAGFLSASVGTGSSQTKDAMAGQKAKSDSSSAQDASIEADESPPMPRSMSKPEAPSGGQVGAQSSDIRREPMVMMSNATTEPTAEFDRQIRQVMAWSSTEAISSSAPAAAANEGRAPEWLAQIEHGRRWSQPGLQPGARPDPGTDGKELPSVALAEEEGEGESKAERVFEREVMGSIESALLSGQTGAEWSSVTNHPPVAQDVGIIMAGRDGIQTAATPERPALPDRVLTLQGTPEQSAKQLAQQVQIMVSQNLEEADIRLNPSELGGLRIQVKMEQGEVQVQFLASHPQARELLDQALPRLREMMSQQGLNLSPGQGQLAGQQGGFNQNAQQEARQEAQSSGESSRDSSRGTVDGDEYQASGEETRTSRFGRDAGRIDFFA